jgi:hypothetical protein
VLAALLHLKHENVGVGAQARAHVHCGVAKRTNVLTLSIGLIAYWVCVQLAAHTHEQSLQTPSR